MPPRLLLALLLTSLVAAPSPATVSRNTGARPWPLLIDINLSSSFGEYRSGHLHAGVDIKTNGRIGYACQAVGNGYVSRLRASPNGYGRAIYLTLDSGETCVYAHLAEFAPQLEAALHQEQRKADSYTVDVYYDEPQFTFRRGDIIGYTGTSGTTAPGRSITPIA